MPHASHACAEFWAVASIFWNSGHRDARRAMCLLAIATALLLGINVNNVILSFLIRWTMHALEERDQDLFLHHLGQMLGVLALITPMEVWFNYLRDRLALLWREWLTEHFVEKYLAHRRYYVLELRRAVDNPDQRIHEDINHLTSYSVKMALDAVHSTCQLLIFFWVLWSMSAWLALSQLMLAAAGTCCTVLIGHRLVGLNKEQQHREADFRYSLVHLRDHSEAVAFYQGEGREKQGILTRFDTLCRNREAIIRWQCVLSFFTVGYSYLPIALPYFLAAPLYFNGSLDLGGLQQAGMAFQKLHTALALVVHNFQDLSSFDASIKRLRDLQRFFEHTGYCPPMITRLEGPKITACKLTVVLPNWQRVLLKDLHLEVAASGPPLLIVGSSGVGKTAVLRTIAGLWQSGQGVLTCPSSFKSMLFMPQKPYMTLGTLRQQLQYPEEELVCCDDALLDALHVVNLGSLPERMGGFDRVLDWATVLSVGEQQRLSIARVLLLKPTFAILDEATSALDEANEARVYEELQRQSIMFLSVGHRMSLLRFHGQVLQMQESGTWRLLPVEEYSKLLAEPQKS